MQSYTAPPMTVHRMDMTGSVRTGGLAALTAVLLFGMPMASSAAVDANCFSNASRDLSNELNSAYSDYSDEMEQITKNLSESDKKAYQNTDAQLQQNLINRSRQDYAYGQSEANRRLGSKVYQAWNTYYSKRSSCDPSASSNTSYQYQQDPYANTYPYQQSYGNPYQYPYNTYQQSYGMYQYPYNYQPYPYSSYGTYRSPYGGYSYPYEYIYNQGYSYPSSVQYYDNCGVQYNNNGQYICPQVVMTTLPSGCGYDCTLDSSGCRRCEVSCRRSAQRTETCGCAQSFRPVCGKDGVTYTNECYADCAGVEVRKMNVCS